MGAKKNNPNMRSVVEELASLVDEIGSLEIPSNTRARNLLREALQGQRARLDLAMDRLDPVLKPTSMFDPGDPQTAGRIIALTMVAQPRHSLASIRQFYGAGVYAIYYNGPFPAYSKLSGTEQPIYVGKADPKEPTAKDPVAQGTALCSRLGEHAKNIAKATSTLKVEDFECRFLIVQSGYQKSAEDYLINFFRPIWNNEVRICFGLGKHGDSAGTRANKRSPWDTLHPGRSWADDLTEDQKPAHQILEEISQHVRKFPPHVNVTQIINDFVEDLRQITPPDFHTATGWHAEVDASAGHGYLSDRINSSERLF